jgi:hypothetical protein
MPLRHGGRRLRALAVPELPEALTRGDLEAEWPDMPFWARRGAVEARIARVTLLRDPGVSIRASLVRRWPRCP